MKPRIRYYIELPKGHGGLEKLGVPLSGEASAYTPTQALARYLKRHGGRPLYEELLDYLDVPNSGLVITPLRQHTTGRMSQRELSAPPEKLQKALVRARLVPPEVQMELFSTDF